MQKFHNLLPCFVSLTLLLLISSNLHCQEKEDVLYLKDGSIIRGSIIQIKNDTVKIETVGRNVFVYSMEQVQKMQKEETEKGITGTKQGGYFVSVQPGFLIGTSNFGFNNNASMVSGSLQMIHDYWINQQVSAGAGFGIEGFGQTVMPLFGNFNYFFLKQGTSPYAYARGGYSLSLQRGGGKGGPMAAVGLGMRKYLSYSTGFIFKFGYRYQTVEQSFWNGMQQIDTKDIYHRLSLGFGLFF